MRIQESTAVRGGRVVNLIRVTSLAAVPSLEGEGKKGKRERGEEERGGEGGGGGGGRERERESGKLTLMYVVLLAMSPNDTLPPEIS